MTLPERVRTLLDRVADTARRFGRRLAARLERARSADADAPPPGERTAQSLCRACGATYDSRCDACRACGSRMVEPVPEQSAGLPTDLVESPREGTRR